MVRKTAATPALSLVLHDVAPATWSRYQSFVEAVDRSLGVPLTLLVVPDLHRLGCLDGDPVFVKAMAERLERGDELVLHGYYHDDPGPLRPSPREWFLRRIYTHEGEFLTLDAGQCRRRLEEGLALFYRLGWPVRGFVPPAWLLGPAARQVVSSLPFAYTSDPGNLIRLPEFRRLPAPTLVWSARSPWRRGLSRWWNDYRIVRRAKAPLLRLGLHPVDMQHRSVREYWLRTLDRLLHDRVPMTKSTWLGLDQ